ncbi:MAG TPA: hypothetical protein VEL47_04000 [Myxococcota bacterium]|nr:hypothetical protein [Myxococcota bacterium]
MVYHFSSLFTMFFIITFSIDASSMNVAKSAKLLKPPQRMGRCFFAPCAKRLYSGDYLDPLDHLRQSVKKAVYGAPLITANFSGFNESLGEIYKPDDVVTSYPGSNGNYISNKINQIRERDGVRLLQQAIQQGDMAGIHTYLQYAGYWFPDGSSSLLEAIYSLNGQRLEEVVNLLLDNKANPKMFHLGNLNDPIKISPYLRLMISLSGTRDGATSYHMYFNFQLQPALSLGEMLLTREVNEIVDWCVTHFKDHKKLLTDYSFSPDDEKAADVSASLWLQETLHNAIAASTSLLSPFSDQNTPIDFLGRHAALLARFKLIEQSDDPARKLKAAKKAAPDLSPKLTKTVSEVVTSLMKHPDVRFCHDDLERGYLFQTSNFSEEPLSLLPNKRSHIEANFTVCRTIDEIREKTH